MLNKSSRFNFYTYTFGFYYKFIVFSKKIDLNNHFKCLLLIEKILHSQKFQKVISSIKVKTVVDLESHFQVNELVSVVRKLILLFFISYQFQSVCGFQTVIWIYVENSYPKNMCLHLFSRWPKMLENNFRLGVSVIVTVSKDLKVTFRILH